MSGVRRLLAAALLTGWAVAASGAFDQQAALTDSQAAIGREIGNYRLRDSQGRELQLQSFRGKPLVVNFIYTGCFQVCPTTTRFLRQMVSQAESSLGAGTFNVATIGFNLPFDTPSSMKDFARKQAISAANWHFLTPSADTVGQLTADFGFRYEATVAGFDHLLQVSIVDAQGRLYRQVYGDTFDAPGFVGPLLELAQNAPRPAPGIAAWIEGVKLLCTIYDPNSGRYRVNYAVVIQLLIGASVILAGIWSVAIEWRRRRRADG